MKLKYLFPSLVAAVAMLASCSEDNAPTYLSSVQVSSSYVTFGLEGGSKTITINSSQDWTMDYEVEYETDSLDALTGKKGTCVVHTTQLQLQNDNVDNTWVKVSHPSGGSGSTNVTFSADPTKSDRETTLKIKVGDEYQTIVVAQKDAGEKQVVTVKDVVKDGVDGVTYRVRGTCTSIANTTYGNWYMTDEDGNSLYIYGTVDASGSYNWSNFNIEVNDVVTVEGARTTYGSTIELVDASFVTVEKALLVTKETDKLFSQKDTTFTVAVTQKGDGLTYRASNDWLKFVNSGYDVNANGDFVFTIKAEANTTSEIRVDTLFFESTKTDSKTKVTSTTVLPILVTQLPAPEANVTIYDLAQKLKDASSKNPATFYVDLKGAAVKYKNGNNIFVEDETGGLLVYSSSVKLNIGDVVSGRVWGSGYAYNHLPEATVFNYESTVTKGTDTIPTKVTLAELAANYEKYLSCYICIENVTVAEAIDVNYGGVVSAGSVTDGTDTFALNLQKTGSYKQKNHSGNSIDLYYNFQAATGDVMDLVCIPTIVYIKETKQYENKLNIYQADWLKKK